MYLQEPFFSKRCQNNHHYAGGRRMITVLLNLCTKTRLLFNDEQGQDLVEYALIMAMMCLGATAGVQGFATALNVAIGSISANIAAV
jgi:pilus assembly protein Flp/PilA